MEEKSIVGFVISESSLILISLSVVCFGSYQSVRYIRTLKEKGERPEVNPLTVKEALKTIVEVIALLAYFYIVIKLEKTEKHNSEESGNLLENNPLYILLNFISAKVLSELISPVFSFLVSPILRNVPYHLSLKKGSGEEANYVIDKHFTHHSIACILCCSLFVGWYIYTKNWILNNIIAISAGVIVIKHFHLNKMMTGCILLSLFVIVDVISVFGSDVMVTVATSLDIPAKLLFPADIIKEGINTNKLNILGMGDIVFPGTMISFLLRFDLSLNRNSCFYFYTSIISYFFGLLMTSVVLYLTQHAQPALLYLVPCCVIPPLALALFRGDGAYLFNFEDHPADNVPEDEEDHEKIQ